MRILLNGLTQRPGGGMVVLQALVSGMANATKPVELVVIVYDSAVYACLQDLGFDNVRVIHIAKHFDLVDKLAVPLRVRAAAKRYQCDVLLTLNFYVPFLPVPQIVYHVDLERFEHHSLWPLSVHSVLEKIRDSSAKKALRKADANVFESNFILKAAREHCKIHVKKPSVIYIGIDEKSIKTTDAAITDLDYGLIVVVTNPLAYKNNEALIPVVVELLKHEPKTNWRVRLFGGQDELVWRKLINLAAAAQVRERFEFKGYQARSVLNDSLDVAVCELNTSRLESFCMVALEAMARGCPVIVSGDAAMPESVGDAGVIIDAGKACQIAKKIIELNCSSIERMEIKKHAIMWASKHTWAHSGKAFCELCGELSTS